MMNRIFYFAFFLIALQQTSLAAPSHAIAMHGQPALPADFTHLTYANPLAKKGGELRYGVVGTFDSLNPFILKSMRTSARGIWDNTFGNLIFESLMKRAYSEPFTLYGLLAKKVEMPDSRQWIEFHLNEKAKFADGVAVKPSDVIFTFNLLKTKGRPPYSSRMNLVDRMEQTGTRQVKIFFNEKANRETPLLFALMPIFPAHATNVETFANSTLTPPMGSGPYQISEVKAGQKIIFTKNKNYWGENEPVNIGFFNFDKISIEYFANQNSQFEAFKKQLYDIHIEPSSAKWQTNYNFNAIENGKTIKQTFEKQTPSGMLGFIFNTRRDKFKNKNVRKALAMAFDFEWVNENLFHNSFTRTTSFWQDSYLSSLTKQANEWEKTFFKKYPNLVEPEVLAATYRTPKSDGSGRDRNILKKVISLLAKQGYKFENGKMLDQNNQQLKFEILAPSASVDMEKIILAYKDTLARLGIIMNPRFVDDSQFQNRAGQFDYDMIIRSYSSSLSPGAEQKFRWGSISANMQGSFNFAGANEPALDELIEEMLKAKTTEQFSQAVHAFDRVLISQHYLVPLYHSKLLRIAHNAKLKMPDNNSLYGVRFPTWWQE